jgi:hypothetical protein
MKYLLLAHHNEAAFDQIDAATRRQLLDESIALTHALHAKKQYLSASPLQPVATATIVRVRGGKAMVTEGPFIETHEQVAGYYLIEAANKAEAIEIAKRVPGARIGSVEVRPLVEITGLPGE